MRNKKLIIIMAAIVFSFGLLTGCTSDKGNNEANSSAIESNETDVENEDDCSHNDD